MVLSVAVGSWLSSKRGSGLFAYTASFLKVIEIVEEQVHGVLESVASSWHIEGICWLFGKAKIKPRYDDLDANIGLQMSWCPCAVRCTSFWQFCCVILLDSTPRVGELDQLQVAKEVGGTMAAVNGSQYCAWLGTGVGSVGPVSLQEGVEPAGDEGAVVDMFQGLMLSPTSTPSVEEENAGKGGEAENFDGGNSLI